MRFFPDRELMLRTDGKIRFVKVSKTLQMFVFVVVVALSGWAIFSSFSFFVHNEVVASKNREIFDARMVYHSLLSEVSEYQDKFSSLTQELGKNHGLMLDQVEKNATLQQNLRSVENKLETSNTRHNEIVSARAALKNKLSSIENEMKELNSHNFNLKGNLNSVTTDLESALSQRNFVRSQSKKLSRTVAKLENDLETLHKSEKDILINLTERTKSSIDDIHFVLKHTGLKVAQLLKGNQGRSKKKLGQGGPFIAFAPDTEPAQRLKANLSNLNSQLQQFTELQDIMKRLPLAESTFTWAREMNPIQPLTTGPWRDFTCSMSERPMALSDIISFHGYGNAEETSGRIELLRACGRPILCTEWLCRQSGNTFEEILPIFACHEIGWYH